jgi:hypothetical protein
LDNIRKEVGMMLDDVNARLAEAEHLSAQGTLAQKVDAAGELSFLRGQKDMIVARMKVLDGASANAAETPLRWLKEEIFNLKLRLESWIAGG